MASALGKIIEALSLDKEVEDDYWWDTVGSIEEAKRLVSEAFKETPTKENLIFLVNIIEINNNELSDINLYYKCLDELRRELIQIES